MMIMIVIIIHKARQGSFLACTGIKSSSDQGG